MRSLVWLIALLGLSGSAYAATTAHPSASDLARAIGDRTGVTVSPEDVRVGSCHGPEEEPTEFECTWRQRIDGRWRKRKGWFAIDGSGWIRID